MRRLAYTRCGQTSLSMTHHICPALSPVGLWCLMDELACSRCRYSPRPPPTRPPECAAAAATARRRRCLPPVWSINSRSRFRVLVWFLSLSSRSLERAMTTSDDGVRFMLASVKEEQNVYCSSTSSSLESARVDVLLGLKGLFLPLTLKGKRTFPLLGSPSPPLR